MAYFEINVITNGVTRNFNNAPWDAVSNPNGLPNTGWRQNDNLFNMLLGILQMATTSTMRDTSTTSLAIGVGSKTVTLANNAPIPAGMSCYLIDADDATKMMFGTVADHTDSDLTVEVTAAAGSATVANWIVQPSGPQGEDGDLGMSTSTSMAIALGSVTFDPVLVRNVAVGAFIQIINSAADWMWGQVTAVGATTVTVDVTQISGSGTFTNWTTLLTGPQPAQNAPGYNFVGIKTSAYTLNANEEIVADCRAGAVSITLPTGASAGVKCRILKVGSNTLTLVGTIKGDAGGGTFTGEGYLAFGYVDGTYGYGKGTSV